MVPGIDDIARAVAAHFDIALGDLRDGRTSRSVRARHTAWWLCRQLTDRSLPAIAARLGPRSDGVIAVMAGVQRMNEAKACNPRIAADLAALTQRLKT
jgi:chromosomal replication initiation ATPase DnaA